MSPSVSALAVGLIVATLGSSAGAQAPGGEKPGAQAPAQPAAPAPAPAAAPAAEAPAPAPATEKAPASEASAESPPATESEPFEGAPPAVPSPAEQPDDPAEAAKQLLSEPRVIDTSNEPQSEEPPPPPPDPNSVPFTHHVRHFDFGAGARVIGTHHDGLEPFLETPVMAEPFVRGGMAFKVADRFAIAALLEGSFATTQASARSQETKLDVQRLTLGLEGRYHFHHRFYGYGRLAPGLEFAQAKISELVQVDGLADKSTSFHADASAGLALRLAGSSLGTTPGPRLWLFLEGGYRLSTNHKFSLVEESGPPRAEPLELPALNTSGGMGAAGALITF